jgi:gliding motility-associated-like protein
MEYTVTAYTQYGCQASDTVKIILVCHEENVVIPGAFTPNNDGINDIFYPLGKGAKIIRSFMVYGRWGNLVFERHNISLNDISNGWDGKAAGIDQPVGAYIYFLDIICDTGDEFTKKGTVMLER